MPQTSIRWPVILIAILVPAILFGNALIVLMLPWMADAQYALPGFPDDPFGLTGPDRADLAETGIRSVWPIGPGTELLVEARLPDGDAAFGPREISHMEDVRVLVRALALAWVAALLLLAATLVWLRARSRELGTQARATFRETARTGLGWGGLATIGLVLVAGLLMLVGFDAVFDGFHGIFFEGDSWKFSDDATLRRLYPDAFWGIAAGWLITVALVQAVGLVWWSRVFSQVSQ